MMLHDDAICSAIICDMCLCNSDCSPPAMRDALTAYLSEGELRPGARIARLYNISIQDLWRVADLVEKIKEQRQAL